jgi:hypothetical protein
LAISVWPASVDPESSVRQPLLLCRLQNALADHGMLVESVVPSGIAWRALWFLPVVAAIMLYGFIRRLFGSLESSHWLSFSHKVLLGGKYLVIVVRKADTID